MTGDQKNGGGAVGRRSDHSREELHELIVDATQEIVARDGLAGLSIRKIGDAIGYSSGTLYNVFADLNDILVHVNARTLDTLEQEFGAVAESDDVAETLSQFGARYIAFAKAQPHVWRLLFEARPSETERPVWFYEKVDQVFARIAHALERAESEASQEQRRELVLMLWASLNGLCLQAIEESVIGWSDVEKLAPKMIRYQLAGALLEK